VLILNGGATLVLSAFVAIALNKQDGNLPQLPPHQAGILFNILYLHLAISVMGYRIGTRTDLQPEHFTTFTSHPSGRFGLMVLGRALNTECFIFWIPATLLTFRACGVSPLWGLLTSFHLLLIYLTVQLFIVVVYTAFYPAIRKHPGNIQIIPSAILVGLLVAIHLGIFDGFCQLPWIQKAGILFQTEFAVSMLLYFIIQGITMLLFALCWMAGCHLTRRHLSSG
jgi:hypothetical protein